MTTTTHHILTGDITLNAESTASWVQMYNQASSEELRDMAIKNALESLIDLQKAVKDVREQLSER